MEMSLRKLNVHVLRSNCAILSGGRPGWELCTAPWMLRRGRTRRIDPSRKVNFANFCSEQMGANTFLCCVGCLTGVLPGWIFGRKAEELLTRSPIGTSPPSGGMHKSPFSPQGISKITCEPIPTAQTLKGCVDALSGTNHRLLLRLSPPVPGGC